MSTLLTFSTSGNLRARYLPAAQIVRDAGPAETRGIQDTESCMTQCATLELAGEPRGQSQEDEGEVGHLGRGRLRSEGPR